MCHIKTADKLHLTSPYHRNNKPYNSHFGNNEREDGSNRRTINAVKKKLHQQNRPCTVLSKEHYTTQTEKVFENKLVLTSFSLSNIFDVWQQFLSSTKFAHFKVIQVGLQYANWESLLELHKKTKVAPPDQSSILHSTTRFWMLE